MISFDLSNLLAVAGLSVGILTALAGFLAWLVNFEKRRYGLERDFAHMKRNFEQIQLNVSEILDEFERRFDISERDLLEIKSVLKNLQNKDF